MNYFATVAVIGILILLWIPLDSASILVVSGARTLFDLNGSFLDLNDTPNSYSGQAGKFVSVNAGETGLQFTSPSAATGDTNCSTSPDCNSLYVQKNPIASQTITNTNTEQLILQQDGNVGNSTSVGGAFLIDNTDNNGAALIIYSNIGTPANGRLLNVRADNNGYDQAVVHIDNDGTANALEVVQSGQDATAQAFNVVSTNYSDSAFTVTSNATAKGAAKIVHDGNSITTDASAISVDLQGNTTAAQGVYVDSTAVSGTTGKLLRLRNRSVDQFTVDANGSATSLHDVNGFRLCIQGDCRTAWPSSNPDTNCSTSADCNTMYIQKNPSTTQTISTHGLAVPFDVNIYNANAKLEIKQRVTAGSQFYASLEENQNGLGIGVTHGLSILTEDSTETPILIIGNHDLNQGFEIDFDYSQGTADQYFLSPMINPRFSWNMPHSIDANSTTALHVGDVNDNRVFEVNTIGRTAWFKRLSVDDINVSCADLNDNCINKARGDENYVQKFPTGNQTIASNNLILTSGHYETTTGGFRYGGDTGYGMDFPIPATCTFAFSVQGLPQSGTAFCTNTGAIEMKTLDQSGHAAFMLGDDLGMTWTRPRTNLATLTTPSDQFKGGLKQWFSMPDGNYEFCYHNATIGWKQCGTWISAFSQKGRYQSLDINGTLDVNLNADFNQNVQIDINLNVEKNINVDFNLDINRGARLYYNIAGGANKRDSNAFIFKAYRDANTAFIVDLKDTSGTDRNTFDLRYDQNNHLQLFTHDLAGSAASLASVVYNIQTGQIFQRLSSPEFKSNIHSFDGNVEKLYNLNLQSWTDNTTGLTGHGYLTTQVCGEIPEVCVYNSQGQPYTIDYTTLSLFALQELQTRKAKDDLLSQQNDIMKTFICSQTLNPAAQQACNALNVLNTPVGGT